jgi:alpha-beta hydrolase superfamily lysophospholipase
MTEHKLPAKDGLKLYTKDWEIPHPKAVILIVHGFGEHVNRYDHVAAFFNENEYAVIGQDTRGYGQSEGKRGHTPSYDTLMDDINTSLEYTRSIYPNIPVFLWGHSMGGNLTLNFVLRRKPNITGIVVTGAWIRLAFEPSKFLVMAGKIMRNIYPSFAQDTKLDATLLSRDKTVVDKYINDPLVHSTMTASGIAITEAAQWLNTYEGTFPSPLLMMHGEEDKTISPQATQEFAKRVKGDITYKLWHKLWHEIHNEPEQLQVFQYALGWLGSKI